MKWTIGKGISPLMAGSSTSWSTYWTPSNLTLTEITGGFQLDWTYYRSTYYTEVWRSIEGADYALLTIVDAGTETYQDTSEGIDGYTSVAYKVRHGYQYEYSDYSNIYGYLTNILLTVNADDDLSVHMDLIGIVGAKQSVIFWGDGTSSNLTMDGTSKVISKTYAGTGTYIVQIQSPTSISSFSLPTGAYNTDIMVDLSAFTYATNLLQLKLAGGLAETKGTVANLPATLTHFYLDEYNVASVTGDISHLINLRMLKLGDLNKQNTITGDLSGMLDMEQFFLNGQSVITVDVTNLIHLTYIEGNNTHAVINGDITGLTALQEICLTCGGYLYGDVSGMASHLRYIDIICDNAITGDISTLTLMYRLRLQGIGSAKTHCSLSGSLANLTALFEFMILSDSCTISKLTDISAHKRLNDFTARPDWVYTSAEVNQLLAQRWANKDDMDVTAGHPTRMLDFRGHATSGAPTGQGLTDKAALQAYHSPDDNPAYSLWTILTR